MPVRTRQDDLEDAVRLVVEHAAPTGGVTVPWASVRSLTGVLRPGWMVALGARTSVGKTTVGVQLAVETAKAGQGALVLSLEMTAPEIWARVYRQAGCRPSDPAQTLAVAGQVAAWPLSVVSGGGWSMAQVEAAVERARQQGPLALVVLDYGQLLRGRPGTRLTRLEQYEEITADLKRLAQTAGVVVVALAQFHRATGEQESARPTVASFRSSGSWEMDADQCWLLYRELPQAHAAAWHPDRQPLVLDVGKNRHGATGRALLELHGPTYTVTDRA